VLRGAQSDLLSKSTADEMRRVDRGRSDGVAGVGHAPMLLVPDQIDSGRRVLRGGTAASSGPIR